jgi:hypothetical protein
MSPASSLVFISYSFPILFHSLIACLITCAMAAFNFYRQQLSEPHMTKLYHIISTASAALYATFTNIAFLDLGRRFYPKTAWRTAIWHITIGGTVIYDALLLAQVILLTDEARRKPNFTLNVAGFVSGFSIAVLAFLYTFKPILSYSFESCASYDRSTSAKQASCSTSDSPQEANVSSRTLSLSSHMIQPQNIAVGFWYFTTTSIVGISCFAFNLYFSLRLQDLCMPNVHAIDYLHKALFVMNLSIPLPGCVGGLLKRSRVIDWETWDHKETVENDENADNC